ncbi:MAG: triose-phosphate isomerase [Planctomycetota bacterium]
MSRSKIIAGNWKLNPPRHVGHALFAAVREGARARGLGHGSPVRVVLFPPLPYLERFGEVGALEVSLGVQSIDAFDWGAFTGAVSPQLVHDFGARYALVGHSEQRLYFGLTDTACGRRVAAAAAAQLTPILCIGETAAERDASETLAVVERQLAVGLAEIAHASASFLIAYEPVWAIGTGRVAAPKTVVAVHEHVRDYLVRRFGPELGARTPILYGGSVTPENASALLSERQIDGALVGGASLNAAAFLAIVDSALAAGR